MRSIGVGIVVILGACGLVRRSALIAAQQAPSTFEVASIRLNRAVAGPANLDFLPGRFRATRMPLRRLIQVAWRLHDFEIVGSSEVLDERFDVAATVEGNPPIPTLQSMLQTLLSERFKLALRHETRTLPIYALVVSRSDGKTRSALRPSGPECRPISVPTGASAPPPPPPPPGGVPPPSQGPLPSDPNFVGGRCVSMLIPGMVSAREMGIDQFVNLLGRFVGRRVVNRTGLAGRYDIDLAYTPDQPVADAGGVVVPPADGASIFTALQEQLGLKLEPARGPVDVLVIDHVERPTAD